MLLTEEEAKKRWCPFARVSADDRMVSGNHACNRFSEGSYGHAMARCIASECMAWKWREDRLENVEEEAAEKLIAEGWRAVGFRCVGPRGLTLKTFTLTRRTDHGSCGLASPPQEQGAR